MRPIHKRQQEASRLELNLQPVRIASFPKCIYHKIARDQRVAEDERGVDRKFTQGYVDAGCYDGCEGFNLACDAYEPGARRKE